MGRIQSTRSSLLHVAKQNKTYLQIVPSNEREGGVKDIVGDHDGKVVLVGNLQLVDSQDPRQKRVQISRNVTEILGKNSDQEKHFSKTDGSNQKAPVQGEIHQCGASAQATVGTNDARRTGKRVTEALDVDSIQLTNLVTHQGSVVVKFTVPDLRNVDLREGAN